MYNSLSHRMTLAQVVWPQCHHLDKEVLAELYRLVYLQPLSEQWTQTWLDITFCDFHRINVLRMLALAERFCLVVYFSSSSEDFSLPFSGHLTYPFCACIQLKLGYSDVRLLCNVHYDMVCCLIWCLLCFEQRAMLYLHYLFHLVSQFFLQVHFF